MTKAKAYYEAYLVLKCLSDVEYSLIPKYLLEEIEAKMEVDDSIVIDESIPLDKQKLDEKTYSILDRVIKAIENSYGNGAIDNPELYAGKVTKEEKKQTKDSDEIIKLKNIISALEEESKKVEEAKQLYYDYKEIVARKDQKIRVLQIENNNLKKNIASLKKNVEHIPKFIRKLYKIDNLLS